MTTRFLNLIPTRNTRRVAEAMVQSARTATGADAVLEHLGEVDPSQIPALIGVLLNQGKIQARTGRKPAPLRYSEDERRAGYTAYKNGARDSHSVACWREYQRVVQMRWRERVGR